MRLDEIEKIKHNEAIMWLISWYKNRLARTTQSFTVTYQVNIKKVAVDDWLILPYPHSTSYQVMSDMVIESVGKTKKHEFFFAIQNAAQAKLHFKAVVQVRAVDLRTVQSTTIKDYQIKADDQIYCQPDAYIQSDLLTIKVLAKELTIDCVTVVEIIKTVYEHTVQKLQYGDAIPGLYSTRQATERQCVDCGGFSTYLAALLRACQIPARLVSGFWAGHTHNEMHAWIECLLPSGDWLPLDPSVDYLRRHGRTTKLGGFNFVGSDRIVMNTGSHHTVNLNNRQITPGIIQTPLLVHADGRVDFIDEYFVVTQ